jgi:uncharacterized protein (DUF2147 family)
MLFKRISLLFLLCFFTGIGFANQTQSVTSPVGRWKTIDDATGQAKSIIEISANSNGVLNGKVAEILTNSFKRCTECKGEKHNQPILGMEIMHNFHHSKDNKLEWVDGEILDPNNGKIYHCTIRLAEKGRKLVVRGYIGLPVFGRSQTWERAT